MTHEEIIVAIHELKPAELKDVEVFDVYSGPNLPEGKKSLAYSFVYQPEGASLTDEAVNNMHFELVDRLKKRLGVELR